MMILTTSVSSYASTIYSKDRFLAFHASILYYWCVLFTFLSFSVFLPISILSFHAD